LRLKAEKLQKDRRIEILSKENERLLNKKLDLKLMAEVEALKDALVFVKEENNS